MNELFRKIKLLPSYIYRLAFVETFIEKPKRIKFYGQFISKNDLVFDVGANIGNRSSVFLALGARVIAFEPQKKCFNFLKIKFLLNKKITILKLALGSKKEKSTIYLNSSSTISSMSKKWINDVSITNKFKTKWEGQESIYVDKIDNLIKIYGVPKFCKIDVEGFELEVIKGLSKKIPYLSLEFCYESLDDFKLILKKLEKIDSKVKFNFSMGESMVFYYDSWFNKKVFLKKLEKLCKEKESNFFGDIYVKYN